MDEKYIKFDRFLRIFIWLGIFIIFALFLFLPKADAEAALLYTNVAEGTPAQVNHSKEVSIFSYTPTSSVSISSIGAYQVSYGSNAQFWIYNNSTSTGVFDLTETKMMPDGGAEFPGLFDANDVCFPANEAINIAYTSSSNTFTLHSVGETSMARFAVYGNFDCEAPSQTALHFIAPSPTSTETIPQFSHWKLRAEGLEWTGKYYPVVEYWIVNGSSTSQFHRDFPVVSGDRSISAFGSSTYINIQVQHNLAGVGTSSAEWHAQAKLFGEEVNFIPIAISEEVVFNFDPYQDPASYPTSSWWSGVRWNVPYIEEPVITIYEVDCEDVWCTIINWLFNPAHSQLGESSMSFISSQYKRSMVVFPFSMFYSIKQSVRNSVENVNLDNRALALNMSLGGSDYEVPLLSANSGVDMFGEQFINWWYNIILMVCICLFAYGVWSYLFQKI